MYRIVYGLLYAFSLLPLRFLYLFADAAYLILYYVIGYRKKVVRYNLSIAFPDKTEEERKRIAKKFYRNFTESFIETIKALSASPAFVKKHISGNYSVVNDLYEKGVEKIQIHLGHHFNWEYGNLSVPLRTQYLMLTVYMPITNKLLNRVFYKMRGRMGTRLLSATNIRSEILPYRRERYQLILVADQNPGNPTNAYWVNFFGRPTPFLKAPESGARRGNIPVVFCSFQKERRGYYRVFFELAEENPATTSAGDLTKKYAAFLQRAIEQQPDNYLWSHRRWKWDWKEEYGKRVE